MFFRPPSFRVTAVEGRLRRAKLSFGEPTEGIFLTINMGKLSIAKLFAAVPVAATIVVNTAIYQDKNNIQLEPEKTNTHYYEIDKKYKTEPSLELAVNIANSSTNGKNKSDSRKNALTVKDKTGKQGKAKIVLAASKKAEPKKVVVTDNSSENKNSSQDPSENNSQKINAEQMAVMEKMVSGYPIAKMLPYIAERQPETAAFIVAIAKKESNWGKVSPHSKDGDCFNYWGFKDHRFKFTAGHSCFPSREVAIETVGNRIDKLITSGRNTPAKMSLWKCGSACAKDGNVGKWISDVSMYFQPIMAAL